MTSINTDITFTADTVTICGTTFSAAYSVTPTRKVVVFMTDESNPDADRIKADFTPDHPLYFDALRAAKPELLDQIISERIAAADALAEAEREAKRTEWAARKAQREAERAARAEAQPQREPSEPTEKLWIGTSIKGNGWEIFFDGGYDRTRVIFKKKPTAPVIEAVKEAGFYWSPQLKSWNKKLTSKAFRAAQELANTLQHMTSSFKSA